MFQCISTDTRRDPEHIYCFCIMHHQMRTIVNDPKEVNGGVFSNAALCLYFLFLLQL